MIKIFLVTLMINSSTFKTTTIESEVPVTADVAASFSACAALAERMNASVSQSAEYPTQSYCERRKVQ